MSTDEYKLYTLPQGEGGAMYPELYRQVVRIESATSTWRADDITSDRHLTLAATIPESLGRSTLDFVRHYFADDQASYNCHLFAGAVTTQNPRPPIAHASDRARVIVSEQRANRRSLPLGTHGVYGFNQNGHRYAIHSVIGLGTRNRECLQVDTLYGVLCIGEYATQLAHFRKTYPRASLHTSKPTFIEKLLTGTWG